MRKLLTMILLVSITVTANAQFTWECGLTRHRALQCTNGGWNIYEEDICVYWEGNEIVGIIGQPWHEWELISPCMEETPNQGSLNTFEIELREPMILEYEKSNKIIAPENEYIKSVQGEYTYNLNKVLSSASTVPCPASNSPMWNMHYEVDISFDIFWNEEGEMVINQITQYSWLNGGIVCETITASPYQPKE